HAACDKFFERRRASAEVATAERSANHQRKEALVAEAEALKLSVDWKGAADQLKALQGRWKEIGAGPRADSDAIVKRFRAACDRLRAPEVEAAPEAPATSDAAQFKFENRAFAAIATLLAGKKDQP